MFEAVAVSAVGFYTNGFLIPKNSIRVRETDVAPKKKLIQENLQYKNRYVYGANWRADIITAIQLLEFENPYQITKAIGCSYPSAHRVFNDYKLAQSA